MVDRINGDDLSQVKESKVLTPAEELLKDEDRKAEARQVDACMKATGVDYLSLYGAYEGEGICHYIYTRSYNGAAEDYAPQFLGLTATDGDGVIAQNLWKPEYMQISMYEGEIDSIRWYNPSKIASVDNEQVQLLPWEEIQAVFEKQIDFLLTPAIDEKKQPGERAIFTKPTDVTIDRIHLGLTKLLMQNTGEYKLIPTWSFFGTDNSYEDGTKYETCYLTINALDGSIVDRGVMY